MIILKRLTALLIIISVIIVGAFEKKQQQHEEDTYKQLEVTSESTETVEAKYTEENGYIPTQESVEEVTETISEITLDLRGLAPYYNTFVEAGNKYNVDYKLLIAISALESGWGTSYYAIHNNNIFGWCSGQQKFNSVEECIYYVAEFMSREYLNPNGMYYEGVGIDSIAIHYNENPQMWAKEVKHIYESLGGR